MLLSVLTACLQCAKVWSGKQNMPLERWVRLPQLMKSDEEAGLDENGGADLCDDDISSSSEEEEEILDDNLLSAMEQVVTCSRAGQSPLRSRALSGAQHAPKSCPYSS